MTTYTLKEVAHILGLSNEAIAYRSKILGYEKKGTVYLFNESQLHNIMNFRKQRLITNFKNEVIYTKTVYQTTEILHSKLNFLTLEQL